jgi:hypothetical protein
VRSALAIVVAATLAALPAACVTGPPVPTARCSNPAPLEGRFDGTDPAYTVYLRPEAPDDAPATLTARYHFENKSPPYSRSHLLANLSPDQVAAVRCDPLVQAVSFNQTLKNVVLTKNPQQPNYRLERP